MHDVRCKNISFARYLFGGNNELSKKLGGLTNANYVSQMARGEKIPSSYETQRFEKILSLPDGWLNRDNQSLFRLTSREFMLATKFLALSEQKQHALLTLLTDSREQSI